MKKNRLYYPYWMLHVSGQPEPTRKHFDNLQAFREALNLREEFPEQTIFIREHPGILHVTDYSAKPFPTTTLVEEHTPRTIEVWHPDGSITRGDDLEKMVSDYLESVEN